MNSKKNKSGSFDFKEQLVVGQQGEVEILERYPIKLEVYPENEFDFITSKGKTIEVKTDTYSLDKTKNFFMERYSDVNKKDTKPGGPWRCEEHGGDIFIYYFVRDFTWFQFNNLPELVDSLNDITLKSGLVYIKNKGWTTGGYKVPRKKIMDLCDVYTFNPDTDKKAKKLTKKQKLEYFK